MSDKARWPTTVHRRAVTLLTIVALLSGTLAVLTPGRAFAVGTVLFENIFNDRTVDGTGTVTKPTPTSGTNVACLSAAGNTTTAPLLSCTTSTDLQGSGKLRLTAATGSQVGGVFGATSFPTQNGLDVTFNSYQYGGGAADGLAFALAAVDPANPVSPTAMGPSGASLGYAASGGVSGMPNAYLGIGLDVYGNFSGSLATGTGCTAVANIGVQTPGAVVVRGPGNGTVGYCGLATSYTGVATSKVTLRATTRAASVVPVEVLINPTATAFTADSGVSVSPGTYKVVFTPVGGTAKTLTGTLPSVSSTLYPSTTWLNAAGVPKQLAFGIFGSTGSVTDFHEVSNVKAITFNPVPQLAVTTTSYSAASPTAGAPVNYVITPSVLTGADESAPISVTQTVPTGVVPVGAFGSGWTCAAPVGRTVTCTTTASSFANGTTLPVINVVAIVTGSTVTSTTIQNSSSTAVSSSDANPGTDTAMDPGTLPTTPSGITVSPAISPIAGGVPVTVSGANITAATAIEIGTTAEQQAGTPVVLLPCSSVIVSNCFTVSGSNLVIASMPSRVSAASVSVTVVTAGVASAASYVYADKPATPAAPTATAGITSATVSWVAPAANGSPITGYLVTPYLSGVAQTPISYDATATTRTLTGLTAAASYTFTISAVNAYGTSTASPQSTAVVPYTLPGAPTVSAVSAGDSQATLSWTAPASNGGSIITGYVVTPYIGTVAQTPQTINSTATTATISGLTPGTAYTFTVAAKNAAGTGPESAKSASVRPNVSPTLTFPAPAAGEVAVGYSEQLSVNNGTAPFVWSLASGSLPPGLTLSGSGGLLSGTPTAAGTFTAVVQVTDGSGQSATKSVTIVIAAAPTLSFTPAAGEVNVPYSAQPTLTGGTAPIAWSVTAGSLPAGLTLNAGTGLISGTPTTAGNFTATVTATDAFGQTAAKTVTIAVAALPTFSFAAPAGGQIGVAYSTAFTVAGGTSPLTWSIPAGAAPAGLTLNTATGVLSGVPTTAGTSTFTIAVTDANGQSTSRSVSIVINTGPLVITKTANASSAVIGGTVAYTVTVNNIGATAFTGVTLTDPLSGVLDDAAYNGDVTASSGTASYSAPTLSWTGNVAAGATVTISYTVTVKNPDTGNKILANTVGSTTLGTNCAAGSSDTRCTATVTVAGLLIVKTANVATVTPGNTVNFTIVVTNTGQTPYTAATLTDSLAGVLDDATYSGNGSATSGSLVFNNSALVWTGNLAVGASTTISYSVVVADPDTGNRSLTGTVVSPTAGSSCPSGNAAAGCTATVTVLVPALAISNTANVGTAVPGAPISYTVTLSNTGQTAYTGTAATISLTGAVDDATYTGGATANSGALSYNSGSSTFTWTGDIAIGAQVQITVPVTVRNPDPGDRSVSTVVSAAAAGSTCPSGSSNGACTAQVSVLVPALTITKSADLTSTTPGSVVNYTVSLTNTGQTSYTGAAFSDNLADVLDDAGYGNNAVASTGTVSFSSGTLSWTGNLAIGATATVTYSVTIKDPDPGNRSLADTVVSSTPFNNCAAGSVDTRCATVIPVLIPALSLAVTADVATTTPSSVVHYTVTVSNTGQTTYNGLTATLDISGLLDDATYNNDAVVNSGSLQAQPDGTLTWVGTLAPGASATGTLSVTIRNPDLGDRSLRAFLAADVAGSSCPTGSGNTSCRSAVTVLIPGLTIIKSANTTSVTPGDTVTYTVSVLNSGETSYPAASFTDSLAQVLTDAVYNSNATASSGTVSYASSVLSWTGSLAPGAFATISYTVTVRNPDPGDKRMTNTIVSSTPGSNCPGGGTDPRCSVAVDILVPGLTIVKTASVPTATAGSTVGFSVSITNTGQTAYPTTALTDSLAGVIDDAAYNGDVRATSGTVAVVGSTLSWSGSLTVGAVATITYSATVRAAAGAGDNLLTNTVVSSTTGSNCPAGSADTRCTVSVPIARLVIAQGYQEASTTPGSLIHLSATFTNTGQVPYTGITISSPSADTVDDATPTGDQVASSGTLTLTSTAITWTGSIPVGGTVTVTGTLTVQNPDNGNRLITGTLVSTAVGNNCTSGSGDSRCTAALRVLLPQLSITKTANTTATVPGGTVSYTITVSNSGETPYTGASFTDSLVGVLDDAGYNADATASVGTIVATGSALTWTGDLPVGGIAVIAYTVTVKTVENGDKTMVNPVSSTTVGSTCPPASGNAACRSTVAVLTPGLTLIKTSNVTNATAGATVTYTITVRNTGQTSYPTASFTDSLASLLTNAGYNTASATATSGTLNYTAPVLSWTGALAVGASATISYTVTIKSTAAPGATLANSVVSSNTGSNCPASSSDTRCTATVTVTDSVSITFTKTADVQFTTAGSVVNYTITVQAAELLFVTPSFTEPLAGILDDATLNAGTLTASGGTASISNSVLTWTGPALTGSAAVYTISYAVTVKSPPTGDNRLTGTLTSTTGTAPSNCEPDGTDPRCTNTIPVAALLIQQSYTESSTTPGSLVHLSATFTNTGQYPYNGISVVSATAGTVDDAIPTGDQTATSGSLLLSPTAITWTGNIPVGGTVTITGTLTVQNPDSGDRVLKGTLVSAAPGNNCTSGSADTRCTATLSVLVPGVTISTAANTAFVVPGGTAQYTITVTNSGETPYSGLVVTDSLIGVLDDADYNGNASATVGIVAYSAPTLTWTGNLAVGATAVISFSVTAHNPATGDKTMVNPVSSTAVGSSCLPATGSAACHTTVAVLTPALTITSTADAQTAAPGDVVRYTVTALNTGQTPYGAAAFSVALSGVLDDATYNGDATAGTGTVTVTGQTLTWSGPLGTGAGVTVSYSVTVKAAGSGDYQLVQTVGSTNQGNTCPAGNSDPRCSTNIPIAGLHLSYRTDVSSTAPTGVVRYTGTFQNTGKVPYFAITIKRSFAGVLDDAVYSGDAVASQGNVTVNAVTGDFTWSGDLAVGAIVTVTSSVTVRNPDAGDKVLASDISTTAPASNCPPAGTDPECLSRVTVLIPALTIVQAADRATTTPGGSVGYTVIITNTGQTVYTAATVTDSLAGVLSDARYAGNATATSGVVAFSSPNVVWTGDLALGQTVVVHFDVLVPDPDPGDKLIVNRVFSDQVGSSCTAVSTDAACVGTVTVLVPALDISVTADSTTSTPGSTVHYTVEVSNSGQTDYAAAQFTAALSGLLDDAVYAGDAVATVGSVHYAAGNLTWTGTLPAGATAVISYSVVVADPDSGNRLLSTSVSSAAAGSTCTQADPCINDVAVLIPGLAVALAADVATATPGDQVTFTVTLQNTGQVPYVGTTVTTDLSGVLDDATFSGEVRTTSGVATFQASDVRWTGSLAVGASATISLTVTVHGTADGDRTMSAQVVAPAPGSTCPRTGAGPACTAAVAVLVPALTLRKSAGTATTTPGSTVGYTITIANTGQTPYLAATVNDSLAGVLNDAVYNGDAVASGGGTLSFGANTLRWTGDLPVGASATVTYSVTVRDPDTGDKRLLNSVASTAPGSSCLPGSTAPDCSTVVSVLIPGLLISKSADTAAVVAGSPVGYTIRITNIGETAYLPAVVTDSLLGVLDDADYRGDAIASTGTVAVADGSLTWTGALPVGAIATVTYSMFTRFPIRGDGILRNTALSTASGSNCSTGVDPRCTSVVSLLRPELTVHKTAGATEVVAGGTVRYTVSATNTGEAAYPTAGLADPLGDVLDDAAYNNDATATTGAVSFANGTLSWTGSLAIGQSVTISYSVTTAVQDNGNGVLTNKVSSPDLGSNCPVGSTDPACTSTTAIAARTLLLTDLTPSFTLTGLPGSTITGNNAVTMTVITNSPGGYTVTVQATAGSLTAGTPGNAAAIPISDLLVRESGTSAFTALSSTEALVVHRQSAPSGPAGDAVSNDFQVRIPEVPSDTYSTTLDYIATAQ